MPPRCTGSVAMMLKNGKTCRRRAGRQSLSMTACADAKLPDA
jgi:hypothetical protein